MSAVRLDISVHEDGYSIYQLLKTSAFIFLFIFSIWFVVPHPHILQTSTEHKTASLADEGNSAYCKSSGAHHIKHI